MRRSFVITLSGILLLALAAAALAQDREPTRVEVIAPSTPVLDEYFTSYVIARRGAAVDPGFTGEVWLWTDQTYIRPYHLNFTPADRGMIQVRLKFQGPPLQRVETYQLGSASRVSVWSNPVMPVNPGALRLFWGSLDCDQPGLDFCLSESGRPPALPGAAAVGLKFAWKQDAGRRTVVVARPPDDDASTSEPPRLLALDRKSATPEGLAKLAGAQNLLPADGGLIAVWADDATPTAICAGLVAGRSYAAWGGRVLIAPDGKGRALVAGYGPRLTVSFPGSTVPSITTDDYHAAVTLPPSGAALLAADGAHFALALDPLFRP